MASCDPQGRYERWDGQCDTPYTVHLGPTGHREVVHGAGWLAYIGPSDSPLTAEDLDPYNPVGPAFSAVAAATRLFVHQFDPPDVSRVFDCYSWSDRDRPDDLREGVNPTVPSSLDLGELWTVGCGSVGSAILYFLGLSGAEFSTCLFDMDQVKRLNITRSPIFTEAHVGHHKVDVVASFLSACGIQSVTAYACALDQTDVWTNRPAGTPDILIPAANERNVRPLIENAYPPIQIYGTTGSYWQATSVSHVPLRTGCSLCLFPDGQLPAMACATDQEHAASTPDDEQMDVALPFLSVAAGLMAAADILKVAVGDYPYLGQRAMFLTWDGPRLTTAPPYRRVGCACNGRTDETYRAVLEGSRYARF